MKSNYTHCPKILVLLLCLLVADGCTRPAKARRYLASAKADFQAQNFDKAEIEFKSAMRLSPGNPTAIRGLAFIYVEEGRPQFFVLPLLKKALEQDPTNTEVQLKLGEIYASQGNVKDSGALFQSVVKADPSNERAWVGWAQSAPSNELAGLRGQLQNLSRQNGKGAAACMSALGWIDLREQKTNEAEAEFHKASALDPKMASSYLGMASVCAMRSDFKGLDQALKTAADLSPVRSPARLKYIDFKIQTKAVPEAIALLREITRQAPDYFPAWIYLMKVTFADRHFDECKSAIDKILARDRTNFDALLQLGALQIAERDTTNAVGTLQRLDQLYNRIPPVKYNLAMAYVLNNDKQRAVGCLNDALALDHNYAAAALLLAELDTRMGKIVEAVAMLAQLVKTHPESTQARLALAEAYLAEHQVDDAAQVYQDLAVSLPTNAEVPRRMGLLYEMEGNNAKARAAFEKSLALDPDFLPSLEKLTELDIMQKNFAEAQRRLAAAVTKNPKAADPVRLQGDVFSAEEKNAQAEAAYSKAIELNPDLPDPYLALARLYLKEKQETQALSRLGALVQKNKDPKAMLLIGEIHQMAGRYEKARSAYEDLVKVDPRNSLAMNNLAYLDSEYLGDYDRALQMATKARDLRPNDPHTADTLGWILFKKRQFAHAALLLQQSADQLPNSAEVQMHLGLNYYMLEEEAPARLALQRALQSPAEFPEKDLARRRLAVLNIDPTNDSPAVVTQLQGLLHDDPNDPVPLSRLAVIQERHGEMDKSAESLQKILTIDPQDVQAMTRLARLYADHLNDLRKGLELAKSAHTLAPTDSRASALLGGLVLRSGDYAWALSLLEEASDQSTQPPGVLLYNLAWAYYANGRVKDAEAAMRKAVQQGDLLPDLAAAKQFLGLLAAAKDAAQAQHSSATVVKILEKEPNYVPALMVSALLLESRGVVAEAEATYDKVLSIYPLFTPAVRQLAILHSKSQNPAEIDQAYILAQKARASLPDDLELASTLGVLDYRKADYKSSSLLLQQSLQNSAENPELLYYLGMDYYHLKQPKQSKQALQRAVTLKLASAEAAEARRVLKEFK